MRNWEDWNQTMETIQIKQEPDYKNQRVQAIANFTYLGSTLTREANIDCEVSNKIAKVPGTCTTQLPIMSENIKLEWDYQEDTKEIVDVPDLVMGIKQEQYYGTKDGWTDEFISQTRVEDNMDRPIIPGDEKVGEPGFCQEEEEDVTQEEKMTNITEMVYKKDVTYTAELTNDNNTESNTTRRVVSGDSAVCLESSVDVCVTRNIVNGQLQDDEMVLMNEKSSDPDRSDGSIRFVNKLDIVKVHGGEKRYKCDFCSLEFRQCGHFKMHKRIHTGEKLYKCDVCSLEFIHDSSLKIHLRTHTGEKPYKCDVCGLGFPRRSSLKIHIRTHTGEKPYKCDVCGLEFTHRGNLITHKRIHTGEKPYKCDVCGLEFIGGSSLKRHKVKHVGEKAYKCDVCSLEFSLRGNLITHKRIHTGEKPYKCDVCGLGYLWNSSLKSHKRTHTGEKPYKCDVCGLGFVWSSSLKKHKGSHTGENPFKCDVCGLGFVWNSSLKNHKRAHTGENPFKCDVCGLSFVWSSSLKKHKGIHT